MPLSYLCLDPTHVKSCFCIYKTLDHISGPDFDLMFCYLPHCTAKLLNLDQRKLHHNQDTFCLRLLQQMFCDEINHQLNRDAETETKHLQPPSFLPEENDPLKFVFRL